MTNDNYLDKIVHPRPLTIRTWHLDGSFTDKVYEPLFKEPSTVREIIENFRIWMGLEG